MKSKQQDEQTAFPLGQQEPSPGICQVWHGTSGDTLPGAASLRERLSGPRITSKRLP